MTPEDGYFPVIFAERRIRKFQVSRHVRHISPETYCYEMKAHSNVSSIRR